MTPPSLKDNTADADRLIKGIKKTVQNENIEVGYSLLKKIPFILRESGYDIVPVLCRIRESWRLIDLLSLRYDNRIYGVSVDLGTSTVVIRLLDLLEGEMLDEASFTNPQVDIGSDILTRIHFASQEGGLEKLQTLLLKRINEEIMKLAGKNGVNTRFIVGLSAAGNTTMTHLFLGLDPFRICREPYIPVVNSPDILKASDLNLAMNPESPVLVLPSAGSYLGGDVIAGILSSGICHEESVCILLDVGTNAEVVLGNKEWLMACAGAAGPALEGGVAKMGMMAGPGVIDKVVIDPGSREFRVRTIDHLPPVGICGSGLIDLIAQLFLSRMIDQRGKFNAEFCGERLMEIDGVKHLIVTPSQDSAGKKNLTISQPDIDSLLRSKAAMYTILTTITKMVNLSMEDLGRFYIAGTFGSYIEPKSAITIGMIPDIPADTYKSLGNTSLKGASSALLSSTAKDEIYKIRDRITYIELNVNQDFMNTFNAAKFIPHTDRSLFPTVKAWK